MSLDDYGWARDFARAFERFQCSQQATPSDTIEPARVVFHSHELYRLRAQDGELEGHLAGRLRQPGAGERPAIGDWVVVERPPSNRNQARIVQLLPRRSHISRKVAGARTREQVVAANVDTVFLVMGLDGDFNLRRLERYVVMTRESGAEAVVVLSKADLASDLAERRFATESAAPGLPVFPVSATEGSGLEPLRFYLTAGRTVVLLGSSGVGKSTLLNALCGTEVMRTREVRARDDRGQHTTTHRELILLPDGGLLIDNPGIRELQLWAAGETMADAFAEAFDDIASVAESCRFRDCSHDGEPGCAVQEEIDAGRLDPRRLASLRRLEKEQRYLELRQDEASRRQIDRKLGAFYKSVMEAQKLRRG